MNLAIIQGNIGRDLELRTAGETSVTDFPVATTRKWNTDGRKHEETTWHRVTVWGQQAEFCAKYLHKGSSVLVRGRIQNSSYEDEDGTKKYTSEIIAERVTFLGGDRKEEPKKEQPKGRGKRTK